jgi:hypothetical protein
MASYTAETAHEARGASIISRGNELVTESLRWSRVFGNADKSMTFNEFVQREDMASWAPNALYLVEQRGRAIASGERSVMITVKSQPEGPVSSLEQLVRYMPADCRALSRFVQEYVLSLGLDTCHGLGRRQNHGMGREEPVCDRYKNNNHNTAGMGELGRRGVVVLREAVVEIRTYWRDGTAFIALIRNTHPTSRYGHIH